MEESPLSRQQQEARKDNLHTLVLFNDDYNTFDHVIESLVEICGHDPVQAEQCAVITHFKGSCEVKSGNFSLLRSMCGRLTDRDLVSEIK